MILSTQLPLQKIKLTLKKQSTVLQQTEYNGYGDLSKFILYSMFNNTAQEFDDSYLNNVVEG
jgi:hypothetical protein